MGESGRSAKLLFVHSFQFSFLHLLQPLSQLHHLGNRSNPNESPAVPKRLWNKTFSPWIPHSWWMKNNRKKNLQISKITTTITWRSIHNCIGSWFFPSTAGHLKPPPPRYGPPTPMTAPEAEAAAPSPVAAARGSWAAPWHWSGRASGRGRRCQRSRGAPWNSPDLRSWLLAGSNRADVWDVWGVVFWFRGVPGNPGIPKPFQTTSEAVNGSGWANKDNHRRIMKNYVKTRDWLNQ